MKSKSTEASTGSSMQFVEQQVIKHKHPAFNDLDQLAFTAKNLYNEALYANRKIFFDNQYGKTDTWLPLQSYVDQARLFKDSENYRKLPAKVAQWVLKLVDKAWKSYFSALKSFKKTPSLFKAKPKPPYYLDKIKGRFLTIYTSQALSQVGLRQGLLQPAGTKLSFKSRIACKAIKYPHKYRIQQLRVVPKLNHYVLELVYTKLIKTKNQVKSSRTAGIDFGLRNVVALAFNGGRRPILISGAQLKCINDFYNLKIDRLKSKLSKTSENKSSRQIQNLLRRRSAKLKHGLHCISKYVVQQLVKSKIGVLVIGHNQGQKQNLNLGRKTNRNFMGIPFHILIHMLTYKCAMLGIMVKLQEESYTSKSSALDDDILPKFEKGKKYKFLGKRIKRGLYRTAKSLLVNADVNGALNIIRKTGVTITNKAKSYALMPEKVSLTY